MSAEPMALLMATRTVDHERLRLRTCLQTTKTFWLSISQQMRLPMAPMTMLTEECTLLRWEPSWSTIQMLSRSRRLLWQSTTAKSQKWFQIQCQPKITMCTHQQSRFRLSISYKCRTVATLYSMMSRSRTLWPIHTVRCQHGYLIQQTSHGRSSLTTQIILESTRYRSLQVHRLPFRIQPSKKSFSLSWEWKRAAMMMKWSHLARLTILFTTLLRMG